MPAPLGQLGRLVEELRTLSDPDAAAAQLDAVTADAERRVAEERVRAARAEHEQRRAFAEREDADAAANGLSSSS